MKRILWLPKSGALRVALFALVVLLSMSATRCDNDNKDQAKAVASAVDQAALLVKNGREIRDELFIAGIIDADDAIKVTQALQKVNNSLKAFNNRAQTYAGSGGLTLEGKALLQKLANDIATAATELVSDGTFGVKNRDAQARINAIIGTIRQVALTIVDAVDQLKAKPVVQTQGVEAGLPVLALIIRQLLAFLAARKAREGKTAEEIYADASAQIDENALALAADAARYAPEGEVPELPAELQAHVDAIKEFFAPGEK